MISTKLHAVGLPKIKVFWNKGYDIIIYVNDVTDKVLPLDANYTADVVEPQFYNDLTRKNNFFEQYLQFKFNNLGLALGMILKFYTSVAKGLKLEVRKFWGLIPAFVVVTGKKTDRGAFLPVFHPE